ncbi:SusD/RagB family nutrient-binding outer membrane lipoprotein [Chitinophaga nivalis]|uniref:SusD/RagB family nutrient-binding outer membrane lipoprotein n=1 Tax=Chitinophaga nivalis TaxID=2991709 RepID=A0ABT3IF83_9BACT|nr:SusD/RagB family nutrient-binding outer membrane lipoprotein [Chitinophaga nivalis]MCW3467696.1 SusD/RagB family nutrient-binding outer membrane lipoprotein [Chitinophaga nivalis]MCW3482612.1 SusD/RagB family nutrient-binding outer membrane lipoprotein [Chitinophaga nivalis]
MKCIHKLALTIGAMALIMSSSCKKYLDVNTDPDRPVVAPPASILTGAEVTAAYTIGGADFALVASILSNQTDGASQQFASYQNYLLVADNFSNSWSNMYQGILLNLVELRRLAEEKKYYHYSGTSKILTAYVLGTVTDMWGDVPYSDAFKGANFDFKSKYDKQEDLYKTIDGLLTGAIADLNQPALGIQPDVNDVIFEGDVQKWIQFANSYRLRLLIHQTKKDAAGFAQKVIAAAAAPGGIITQEADDAQVVFLSDPSRANPIYQFNVTRGGYVAYESSYLIKSMQALGDSRVSRYRPGSFYGNKTSPVIFLSSYELQFILAEAHERLGHHAEAKAFYEAGVKGSFLKVGAAIGNYLSHPEVSFDAATDKLKLILTQKYYALYLQPEAYTDWRRTGIPALVSKNGDKPIPRRLPYPQTELSYNESNVPTGITLTTRMWWDQ